jgi:hypothetical protein
MDTDIAGANAAGLPSLMVLTGVNTAADMVYGIPEERPNYVADDLRSLHDDASALRIGSHPAWRVDVAPDAVTVHWTGQDTQNPLTVVRATASAIWDAGLDGRPFAVAGGDDTAHQALEHWSLLRALP